ncbi:hypothetical protein NDK43_25775 [Neobacillus pocheonensis]|uniref:Uncharacterized protein n=1 Tax=Neobacillus pocheonensis TaxID=363869 RepID=A0ABT0WFQ2_9BACI|nr:hypothetical protein [Neobacillus pocheonensis]
MPSRKVAIGRGDLLSHPAVWSVSATLGSGQYMMPTVLVKFKRFGHSILILINLPSQKEKP